MTSPQDEKRPALDDRALASALADLRADPALWRQSLGRDVLAEARRRFARLSIVCGLDEADGATHAWTYWTQDMTDRELSTHRSNLWEFTGGVIRRTMSTEDIAQRKLASTKVLRRAVVAGMGTPLRFQDVDDAYVGSSPSSEHDESGPDISIGRHQALAAVRQLLVAAGLTPVQRDLIFDEITEKVTASANVRAAADRMLRSASPDPSLPAERWRALVSLVLGNAKGTPGLIRLIADGHPAPMSEPHIQRLLPAFLPSAPPVAAGVA